MMRTMKTPSVQVPPWWSGTATFILLAFVAIGTIELANHHVIGAVICFVLAVAYVPMRVLRARLSRAGQGR